jgi:hypothetical protein
VTRIGLDLKVISPTLFAMMALMALGTTIVTSPVFRLLIPHAVARDTTDSDRSSSKNQE